MDALSERMNAAELKITADAIVSTVRSSTAYTTDLAGKASTNAVATAQSAADKAQTTADSAQTAASNAQNTIDSLDIGGRNLLKNSASRPVLSGSDFSLASQREAGKITTLLETQGNAHNWVQSSLAKTTAEITESIGAEYSFSVDVRVTGSFNNLCATFDVRPAEAHSYLLICTAYHDGETYDQWIRLKGRGTVKGTEGARSLICITWSGSTAGSTIEYRNFKLEAGNRATDWTPAPEDVDAGIADAQSAADNAQNAADNAQSSADNAQSTANTNASNIATLVTRITSAEQKITADAIVSTVTKSEIYTTDLAAVQSAADGAQSSANKAQSTADGAQSSADKA